MEAIPAVIAEAVTKKVDVPTIGIGAGVNCDGQVLVFHDMLGLFDRFTPKFVKRYAELRQPMLEALITYREEVETRQFPTPAHSYALPKQELEQLNGQAAEVLEALALAR